MAGLNVYNFKRTHKNLYLNPVRNLFNVDKTENINWKLQIGENSSSKNFYRRIFDKQRNRPVLHVLIPEQEHKNLDCMVFFGKKLILLRNYKISIWLKSMGNREKISLIFRDYKKRLFEVEFAHIKFNGWKRMVLKVPDKFFIPIGKGNYIRPRFLELWGMKISPSYKKNIEFRMGDIKSFRDFRFEKVNIPGR
jgi:hypothetical protein